jgi:hypothetical protein
LDPASTSFVLGYHGCDAATADRVLSGKDSLIASENDYDWLGHGIYFWEHNVQRAYEFALEIHRLRPRRRPRIKYPAVIGAIIDLGQCLNLLDSRSIESVRKAYDDLVQLYAEAYQPLPTNERGPDSVLRRLDCAVIEMLHETREESGEPRLDTVRCAFIEDSPIYEGAKFHAKTHIQISNLIRHSEFGFLV